MRQNSTTPANTPDSTPTTHSKGCASEEDSVMDTSVSQESQESAQEMPIPMRKRKALRSLSHEPVKRTRKSDSGSLPPCSPSSLLSPRRENPTVRLTRSVTPQHYHLPHPQPQSGGTGEYADAQPTILDYVTVPVLPTQQEGGLSSGNNIEASTGEQVQISNVAIGEATTQGGSTKVEGVRIGTEHQSEREQRDETEEEKEDKKSEVESQEASSSQGQTDKAGRVSSSSCGAAAEVVSPRRYSTRRQGKNQGSIVEKLTQSYSARIEQALGSPEVKKKALPSPKRTPKAKSTLKAATTAAKSVNRSGRRSRGKVQSEALSEEMEVTSLPEHFEESDEGIIEGVDSSQTSASKTEMGEQGWLIQIAMEILFSDNIHFVM